jgi:ComF family protein
MEKAINRATNYLNTFLDLFFPKTCPGCGKIISSDEFFCPDCDKALVFIRPPLCPICGIPLESGESHICGQCLKESPFFKAGRSCAIYDEPLSNAIINFKYQGVTALAKPFSMIMLKALSSFIKTASVDLILPVPLHIKRLRQRGFNQALLLANELGKNLKLPVKGLVLKKAKQTFPQVGLSQAERRKNVRGSFKVIFPEDVKDKNILLVDDVFTTGTTVNECSKVLIKAGARGVFVVTLARTYEGKR